MSSRRAERVRSSPRFLTGERVRNVRTARALDTGTFELRGPFETAAHANMSRMTDAWDELEAWLTTAQEGDTFAARCACARPWSTFKTNYRGCSSCGGTGTAVRDLIYTEGGRAYPFFLHRVDIVRGMPRCLGGVSHPGRGIDEVQRTRADLELASSMKNGSVSRGTWDTGPIPADWNALSSTATRLRPPTELRPTKRRPRDRSPTNRHPPPHVMEQLRKEVGFACPVCGSPYLTFHHFDPPWEVEHHHDPARMIALCWTCHGEAAAYTPDQMRQLKRPKGGITIGQRFKWRRDSLVVVCGRMCVHDPAVAILWRDVPVVSFERDADRCLLLNVQMPSLSDEPRLNITRNCWTLPEPPLDLECPPSGELVRALWANGDAISVRFRSLSSAEEAANAYPRIGTRDWTTPIVAVEIGLHVEGTQVLLTHEGLRVGGTVTNGNIRGSDVAIKIAPPEFYGAPSVQFSGEVRIPNWRNLAAPLVLGS